MAAATSVQLRFLTDAAHLMRQAAPSTSAHLMRRRIDLALGAQAAATAAAAAASAGPSVSIAALPQTDVQRQHVCTSCGLILIPGSDGTTLTIQSGLPSQKNKKKKKLELERKRKRDETTEAVLAEPAKTPRVQAPHAGNTKVYQCGLCSRETRIALPPPPLLSKQRKHKATPVATTKAEDTQSVPDTVQATTATAKRQTAPTTAAPPPATPKAASNANSKKRAKNRKAGLLALLDKSRGAEGSGFGSLNLSFDDFRKK